MMNKRGLFGFLAGLLLGAVAANKVEAKRILDGKREAIRLLPGMWHFKQVNPDLEFHLFFDPATGNILPCGFNPSNGMELGFALTSIKISDGLHIAEFAPSMDGLVRSLRMAPPPGWETVQSSLESVPLDWVKLS